MPRKTLYWTPGQKLLDSPILARAVRIVGEDEFRIPGTFAAAGDNLVWEGRREKTDLEILEVTFQNQSGGPVFAQLHLSGASISGMWQIADKQFWSHPGFILMPVQQIFLRLATPGQWAFEVRWRFYYERQK